MVGSGVVEGFRELVELYKAVLECCERYVALQRSYPDALGLEPEAVLKLGEEAGEKLAGFAGLSPSEQEEIVAKLREAVNLMESALNSVR
jgi:phosphosulfolactate phosphohydrolase-like enzyme